MEMLNYAICFICMGIVIWEVLLIQRRNRTVWIKGKDSYIIFAAVVGLVLVVIPIDFSMSGVTGARNLLLICAIFATVAVKRGFSEQGIVKLYYIIEWKDVKQVQIEETGSSKMLLTFDTNKGQRRLFFNKYILADVLYCLEEKQVSYMMQESLKSVLDLKRTFENARKKEWNRKQTNVK